MQFHDLLCSRVSTQGCQAVWPYRRHQDYRSQDYRLFEVDLHEAGGSSEFQPVRVDVPGLVGGADFQSADLWR